MLGKDRYERSMKGKPLMIYSYSNSNLQTFREIARVIGKEHVLSGLTDQNVFRDWKNPEELRLTVESASKLKIC